MTSSLVEIFRCFDPGEAHIIKGALESSGIPCVILDEHHNTTAWMYQVALGGYRIAVPVSFVDQAIPILEAIKKDKPSSADQPWLPSEITTLAGAFIGIIIYYLTGSFLFKKRKKFSESER